MQRLPLGLPLLLLSAASACGHETPGNNFGDDDPWRTDWLTVIDGAVLPGVCPEGALSCPCAGMACDAGSCYAVTEVGDFCVDPGVPAGTKGGACDMGTCAPGLVCGALEADPTTSVCVDPPNDEVRSLIIGGTEVGDNFINRGNIEVYFNGPEGKITVQMRKFTFAPDEAAAQDNWDHLLPWIYSTGVVPPSDEILPDSCEDAFRDGCQIRVWYNGQTQPVRDGADIRVIMPPSYTGMLDIVTEDNVAEDAYPDRGDVTIKDLRGSAQIEVDSGKVDVKLAADILEGPVCGPDLVAACESYENDMMEPAPWDINCGCTDFGQVRVDSRPERATNVTVDMPGDLWGTATLENAQPGMTKSSDPLCTAEVRGCDGAIGSCTDLIYDANFPWKRQTELNDPGESAVAGAGYGFPLTSAGCQNVPYANDPEEFGGDEPASEERGNLVVCSGCLDLPNP